MATLTGPRKRGRKKEPLRQACEALAPTVKSGAGEQEVTVEVVAAHTVERDGKNVKVKAEVVTYSIPKGAVIIPTELTFGKKDENVREQMRNSAESVGANLSISSTGVLLDDGTEKSIFHYQAKEEKAN